MTIKFFLQSNKNPATIYVRLREGKSIDAKSKSGYSVNTEDFEKGKVKLKSTSGRISADKKEQAQKHNKTLINLQQELDSLQSIITDRFNDKKDYEVIDSKWLQEIIFPPKSKQELPNTLTAYFDKYLEFKQGSLKHSTYKRNKSIKARIEKYEKANGRTLIQEVNKLFSRRFYAWCIEDGYNNNTALKTLKMIKTVCTHAMESGIKTHPDLQFLTNGYKYTKREHIHLSFEEINKIQEAVITDETLDAARDWLVISCYTAQRVSDFMRFTKDSIKHIKGGYYLFVKQEKTEQPVEIPLISTVINILDKRNGNFPPNFSKNVDSNKAIYNKLIKKVCKEAGINTAVIHHFKNKETNRYEEKEVPKYDAISTHIGRRSYATNYYGIIPTSLLRSATGHASESQFLRYVGRTGSSNSEFLGSMMLQIEKEEMKKQQKKRKLKAV
ncbi:phage integrase SAM-like domain-containing protein [Aestuariibaculum suncheonense]|uniref:Site-specific integrase n=1 Tax=Aestuariibaculum suncheonense TaxID=1028745 RepID=A0A8J6ULF5_9FLAO|nr:phage integrase SAM-like domain-containing protein [Aestuariibaculum suncheonense]MBD0836341.1 site-specific integrase [Aestuariibaculum suncheonense]